jgi:hypothetical protein
MIEENQFGPIETWRYSPLTGRPLKTGLENFKNLFRRPTFSDWITLFIIVMTLIGSYMYFQETKVCRETLSNLPTICMQYSFINQNQSGYVSPWANYTKNYTNIINVSNDG